MTTLTRQGCGALFPELVPALDGKAMLGRCLIHRCGCPFELFAILAKLLVPTRLETRTKESNIYASVWVANPYA